MNCRPTLLAFFLIFFSASLRSQETVCEGSPCTSNDFTIDYFYLGDAAGNPLDQGACEPGTLVNTNLWINFTANAAASRYSLYLHFNLYVNGIFVDTIDECYFNGQAIPTSVTLNAYSFNWECGAEVIMQDLYMSWQTNSHGSCGCISSHCYSDPFVVVSSPLIADFEFNANCLAASTVEFTSTTSGGTPPYTYFWEFGDGTTSTVENPTHSYGSDGPFTVSLTVQDAENIDYHSYDILDFDSSIAPEINAPPDLNTEGCDLTAINQFIYSETPVQISESELINVGGNLVLGSDLVSLTYWDNYSGTCPIHVIRTFTLTDSCDNIVSTEQNIIISDSVMPTASNPLPINLNCSDAIPEPDINVVTDEADNCSIPTVVFVSDVSDNQSCTETITRTYNVTDACGNSIEVYQLIIIEDDVLPTASDPEAINISCNDAVPEPDINVVTDEADNCSIPTVVFVSDVSDNQSCLETITRTYRVTDTCGHSIEVYQLIIIEDDVLPTASDPEAINISCNDAVPEPDINVVTDEADNCSIPTVAFVSDVSDNQSCTETITRTYSVTDACGNSIEVYQLIIIEDDVLPTASDPEAINISCNDAIPEPDINVVTDEADNCSIPTVAYVSDVSDNQSCLETITRTYRITDECGNFIEVHQLIIIEDDVLPTASDPEAINISCNDAIPAPDINVLTDEADNCSIPTVAYVSDVSDNQSCLETITRTYSVTDACGNSILVTQLIYIIDNDPPELTIEFESEISLTCEDIPEVPSLEFTDGCNSSIEVVFDETINQTDTLIFDIQRTWVVTDQCANQSTYSQSIFVNRAPDSTSQYVQLCIGDDPLNLNSLITQQEASNTNSIINAWDSDTIQLLENGIFDPSSVQPGDYEFTMVSNDDCTSHTIYINVHDECLNTSCIESTNDITISKMVTPNNDGFNDFFEVDFIINEESMENCDVTINVQIYNRWGTKIFESDNYKSNWAGIANSSSSGDSGFLPTGTYYYIVELVNSGLKSVQGYIYLGTE